MAYVTVTVLIDGALDDELDVDDRDLDEFLGARLTELDEWTKTHSDLVEMFILWHGHEPRDCECAQYEQDHSPTYTWNAPA